jgi:hypothetical protein
MARPTSVRPGRPPPADASPPHPSDREKCCENEKRREPATVREADSSTEREKLSELKNGSETRRISVFEKPCEGVGAGVGVGE